MKKLLSLLSVLTISGTAIPTTIAASPYQKQEKLNRNKRENYNEPIIIDSYQNENKYEEKARIVIKTEGAVSSSGVVLNNSVYFGSNDSVYEYDPATGQQKTVFNFPNWVVSSGIVLNNKLYIGCEDSNVYEYDPYIKRIRIVIRAISLSNLGFTSSGVALNSKVYFGSNDSRVYEYDTVTGKNNIAFKTNDSINSSGGCVK